MRGGNYSRMNSHARQLHTKEQRIAVHCQRSHKETPAGYKERRESYGAPLSSAAPRECADGTDQVTVERAPTGEHPYLVTFFGSILTNLLEKANKH